MGETQNKCPHCRAETAQVAITCEACKFPIAGTEKEKAIFIGQQTMNISKVVSAGEVVKKTQIILYIVAGFKALSAFLVYYNFNSVIDAVFYLVIALILAVFSYLLPKKPVVFILSSLAVILGYYLLLFLVNPRLLYSGVLWKFATVMALLYALYTVVESQKLKKKFNL
ncbi:hypothetical protein KORDIASMS9_01032 [Kordia sp. SMS9]|uniref:hypothetical protein n=1 Tax=Kordia sp. SMS9 TaxID=2282170 RepID=UPI000E0D6131|nr:hypothetical protein [Kordia sp. SMS9]AXG68816.1 hypothetical protein KORDIASMS9_01032 [Kordia sp. SMS9]